MVSRDASDITNDEMREFLSMGRMLLAGCDLTPEDQRSGQEARIEWNRGGVMPTAYLNATKGSNAERMGNLLRNFRGGHGPGA